MSAGLEEVVRLAEELVAIDRAREAISNDRRCSRASSQALSWLGLCRQEVENRAVAILAKMLTQLGGDEGAL
jgi:hypothetical protein